jgi:hypothetical protein
VEAAAPSIVQRDAPTTGSQAVAPATPPPQERHAPVAKIGQAAPSPRADIAANRETPEPRANPVPSDPPAIDSAVGGPRVEVSPGVERATPEALGAPVETAEDVNWARLRQRPDAAALRAFLAQYPGGKHAREAAAALGEFAYAAVRNSDDPQALRRFAQEYPEHGFAQTALNIASQLEAKAVAATEIRQVLAHYASAVQSMKIDAVAAVRELNKQQRESFQNLFHARRIEAMLVAKSAPEFPEFVGADSAAAPAAPTRASIRGEWTETVDSGTGEAQTVRREVTVQLRRTRNGWIITGI